MADDNLYSLRINVKGGDAAASEIVKSKEALKSVEKESKALKGNFQEGFQHLALHGFLAEAGHSIGLGRELYPIITMLNSGLTAMGEAVGLAGGPVGILITGLAALGGIAYTAYEHFHKTAESLDKLEHNEAAALKTTNALKQAMADYIAQVGQLPANLQALKTATEELDKAQTAQLTHTEGEQMAALQAQMTANQARQEGMRNAITAYQQQLSQMTAAQAANSELGRQIGFVNQKINEQQDAFTKLNQQYEEVKANIRAQADGSSNVQDQLKKETEAHKKAAEAAKKGAEEAARAKESEATEGKRAAAEQKRAVDAATRESQKMMAQYEKEAKAKEAALSKELAADRSLADMTRALAEQASEATMTQHQKQLAQINQFVEKHKEQIQRMYEQEKAAAIAAGQSTVAAEQDKDAALKALSSAAAEKEKENQTQIGAAAQQLGGTIESSIGDAFAKSIVEGKNFGDAMKNLSKDIAEQIISDLVRIAIQAAITKVAVGGIFGAPL